MPLHAEFSVANAAAVLGVLCHAGVSLASFAHAAETLGSVPGRMEYYRAPGRPHVVVDFAHTPDALDKVLAALRVETQGRLICVFGCGGDRDPGKRPLMAQAAERHADVLWLTSDNPRSEAPEAIIADMMAGLSDRVSIHQCADRAEAIAGAIGDAVAGDTVLVAGKGHEDYQESAGRRVPFSDRALVAELLGEAA
jgi:UDP-N-acetylmuramoyl-L-alanyl-D-glutamate--2,6-diaminopimelate ligase